jgi:serine/threonine protein kinase
MAASRECPGIESWHALFSGILQADERERAERHLETCELCQGRLDRAEECGDPLLRLGRQVGDPTLAASDPTLTHVLERLHEVRSSMRAGLTEPADLFFLCPSDRPDVVGMLGHYEVTEVIGQGGMGVVLKAFDPPLHRLVAIKVMAPAVAGSATARRRFTREAQAAAAVCHDHVVTVHGVDEADGLPYMVMQYVAGESLQSRLDRVGPLELVEIVRIGLQTALGLGAAHAQGLIHRDIKPSNLLLENGLARVKITDFGLARMTDDVALTQNGVVAGTPEYMAPEQARGELVDHRSDLFSLGSVLYAMCTGVPPFSGSSAVAVLRQVSDQTPRSVREVNPDIPAWLDVFVRRLMEKDPAKRFESAAEVAALLEGYLAHLRQPTTVRAPSLPKCPTEAHHDPQLSARHVALLATATMSIGLVSLMILSWLLATRFVAGNAAEKQPPSKHFQEYRLSLKDDFASNPGIEPAGPNAQKCVRFETEGLRITLPRGWDAERENTGVNLNVAIKGDFEITLSYEILQEPTPREAGNQQTRITLGVQLEKEGSTLGTISRRVQAKGATQHVAWMMFPDEATGQRKQMGKGFATRAKSGRLRLSRTGSVLSYLVAEGSDNEFTLLQEYPFDSENVDHIHVAGSTGNARCSLDVRVSDLHIRAESLGEKSATATPLSRNKGWLTTAGIVGMVLTLSLCVVTCLYLRRQRRFGNEEEPTPSKPEQTKPNAPSAAVSFACPDCGQKVKAPAELAGKKVRCPQCSEPVSVPEMASRGSSESD